MEKLKRYFLITLLFFVCVTAQAQLKLGTNPRTVQQSSIIELESTSHGLLLPRMTSVQRDSISQHALFDKAISHGLLIYNTDHRCMNFYDSTDLGSWINPCRPNVPIYADLGIANADTPRSGDLIVIEPLDFLIYKDSVWSPIRGADEWERDTFGGQEVHILSASLVTGDTVVIAEGGKLGLNKLPVEYAIDLVSRDSLLMRLSQDSIREFTIAYEPDSTLSLETGGTPLKLQVGNDDTANFIALDTNGGVRLSEYGDGIFTSASPSYALGVDSTGQLIEFTGVTWMSSDKRLKKSINKLTKSTEKLSLLNGYTYYWNNAHPVKKFGDDLEFGILADELEAVFPDLVKRDRQGYRVVNYMGLIPVLIEANKEQQAQIDELEARIERLEKLIAR